tara:strand:- start:556 stop:792 length:237 start_codon:yes stop_codon:yes gene_type:complete
MEDMKYEFGNGVEAMEEKEGENHGQNAITLTQEELEKHQRHIAIMRRSRARRKEEAEAKDGKVKQTKSTRQNRQDPFN